MTHIHTMVGMRELGRSYGIQCGNETLTFILQLEVATGDPFLIKSSLMKSLGVL